MEFPVLKDFNLNGKRVLLRVDINSPIDPITREILDDTRIKGHVPTLNALEGSKVAILAHQSRPGLRDFTPLEMHAKRMEELVGRTVKYVRDIFGQAAGEAISNLKDGEILMLENVRFCSEEISPNVTEMSPEEQASTNMVQKLSSYVDFYVNDAFAVSHRNQPSIVGFPVVLPCCAGKLLEKEVSMLSRILNSQGRPTVFSFGGAKPNTTIKIIEKILSRGIADVVLTSGVIANIFLIAHGYDLGAVNRDFLVEKKFNTLIPTARRLIEEYGDKIRLPIDLAFQKNASRVETSVEKLPDRKILDVGIETIASYAKIIKEAKMVVANGPCGVFELQPFALGTVELLRAMGSSGAYTVVGGGHLATIAQSINLSRDISFISTGGKATMAFLAKDKLTGIEALMRGLEVHM
jgi:phosphoglycerate kinase